MHHLVTILLLYFWNDLEQNRLVCHPLIPIRNAAWLADEADRLGQSEGY